MVVVKEASLRSSVLGQVRDELNQRKPADGYKGYDAPIVSRDVQDAFEAVAHGKAADAPISINAVVNTYASTLKSKLDAVNVVGPATVTAKEAAQIDQPEMRERVLGLRAELSRGSKPLAEADLARRAARFIADHSAPIGVSGNALNVFFPAFDVGNAGNWDAKEAGIDARLITDGKTALALIKLFLTDAGPSEAKRLSTFDPAKEHLIVVAGSDDETVYYPAAIDKKTGKARGFDSSHNSANFPGPETKEEFEALFGKGSAKSVTDGDYAYAVYGMTEKLLGKGKSIALDKMDPPELDRVKLTAAAQKELTTYFAGMTKLPAGIEFSDADQKTLLAIRDAIKAGQAITVGESYGDPILQMPRKFSGAPTEDYAVGWAINTLVSGVPELQRFFNVNATVQTPNPS